MNPVFVFLVLCGGVALWFLASFAFPLVGKFFNQFWETVKKNITEDTDHER